MFVDLIRLARPYQYSKNLFVFVPAFFAIQLTEPDLVFKSFVAFIAFSLLASAVYVFNDWFDRHDDARHPEKRYRPIASGRVGGPLAFSFFIAMLLSGGAIASILTFKVFVLIASYLALNFAYTIKIKHIAILDITAIASGFVIRLLVGAEATQVYLSHWIIIMTFLLALFLSLAKRRDDVLIWYETEKKGRKVIDGYNLKFLDAAMMMAASIVVLAYILWSISPDVVERIGTNNLYFTAGFVVLGLLRYIQIAFVEEKSGNPSSILLKDRFIQVTLVGWLCMFIWILYLS